MPGVMPHGEHSQTPIREDAEKKMVRKSTEIRAAKTVAAKTEDLRMISDDHQDPAELGVEIVRQ
jgi:hypothetical protein